MDEPPQVQVRRVGGVRVEDPPALLLEQPMDLGCDREKEEEEDEPHGLQCIFCRRFMVDDVSFYRLHLKDYHRVGSDVAMSYVMQWSLQLNINEKKRRSSDQQHCHRDNKRGLKDNCTHEASSLSLGESSSIMRGRDGHIESLEQDQQEELAKASNDGFRVPVQGDKDDRQSMEVVTNQDVRDDLRQDLRKTEYDDKDDRSHEVNNNDLIAQREQDTKNNVSEESRNEMMSGNDIEGKEKTNDDVNAINEIYDEGRPNKKYFKIKGKMKRVRKLKGLKIKVKNMRKIETAQISKSKKAKKHIEKNNGGKLVLATELNLEDTPKGSKSLLKVSNPSVDEVGDSNANGIERDEKGGNVNKGPRNDENVSDNRDDAVDESGPSNGTVDDKGDDMIDAVHESGPNNETVDDKGDDMIDAVHESGPNNETVDDKGDDMIDVDESGFNGKIVGDDDFDEWLDKFFYHCQECLLRCDSEAEAVQHLSTEHGWDKDKQNLDPSSLYIKTDKRHKCHLCKTYLRHDGKVLAKHMLTDHKISLIDYFSKFIKKSNEERRQCQGHVHVESLKPGIEESTEEKRKMWVNECTSQCMVCSSEFDSLQEALSHMEKKHKESKKCFHRRLVVEVNRSHKCGICGCEESRRNLEQHVKERHSLDFSDYFKQHVVSCKESRKRKRQTAISDHNKDGRKVKKSSGGEAFEWANKCEYQCHICGNQYMSQQGLGYHIKNKHGMAVKKYEKIHGSLLTKCVSHECLLCGRMLDHSLSPISGHLLKHGMSLKTYYKKFVDKTD